MPWDLDMTTVVREVPSDADILLGGATSMLELAEESIVQARIVVPVKEGHLRRSIRIEAGIEPGSYTLVAGGTVIEGRVVDYANIVHGGRSRPTPIAARPFLIWGIQRALQQQESLRVANRAGGIQANVRRDPGTGQFINRQVLAQRVSRSVAKSPPLTSR